jgi:hypothetical protein
MVLFPEAKHDGVYTPPRVVGESEREQINAKLQGWVQEVLVGVSYPLMSGDWLTQL